MGLSKLVHRRVAKNIRILCPKETEEKNTQRPKIFPKGDDIH